MIVPTQTGTMQADIEYQQGGFIVLSFWGTTGDKYLSLTHERSLKAAYEVKASSSEFCDAKRMCDWIAENWNDLLEFALWHPRGNLIFRMLLQEFHDAMWAYCETLD
jgi:hypothetical protein